GARWRPRRPSRGLSPPPSKIGVSDWAVGLVPPARQRSIPTIRRILARLGLSWSFIQGVRWGPRVVVRQRRVPARTERSRPLRHADAIICPHFHRFWTGMLETRGG